MKKNEKVVVGMSGGVDSSTAAFLLKEEGYDVRGVTLSVMPEEDQEFYGGSFPTAQDAAKVAAYLGIPHTVVDFSRQFQSSVIDYFCEEYMRGRTPNPCVVCNRAVKWEALFRAAADVGAGFIATGHYARVAQLPGGRYAVRQAVTPEKDQSYALYGLSQEQLKKTILPLGGFGKPEIRDIARKAGIPVAEKPDSQEICFIPDHDYAAYIKRHSGAELPTGNLVDTEGHILGRHKGITHYTIGQRKGLGLSLGHPAYVVKIRPETNEVVIGGDSDVYADELRCGNLNWMGIAGLGGKEIEVRAKIRYNHKGAACVVREAGEDLLTCFFPDGVRAVTPGQSVVFYDEDLYVLGGGIIL